MQKERKAKNFMPKLVYPGGTKALTKFIADHLKYPKEAIKEKIEGTVRLRMDVDYTGKVLDSHIISSLGHGCDKEAQRVVGMLKWETDKKVRKGKVLFHKTLNIHFKLPKQKTTPTPKSKPKNQTQTQISYQIVSSKATTKATKKPASYQYTIKY